MLETENFFNGNGKRMKEIIKNYEKAIEELLSSRLQEMSTEN